MTLRTVHSVYRWGVVTERWLRDQVAPVPGMEVSVIAARRTGTAQSGGVPLRAVGDDIVGGFAAGVDRLAARATGHRWAWPYVRLVPGHAADVVHAHFGDWAYAVMPVADALRAQLVVSFYGYDAGSLPRRTGWPERLRRLFSRAAAVFVEGPAMAARLIAIGCPSDRLAIVPLGVEMPALPDRSARHQDSLRILVAASLRQKKGVDDGLRAIARAAEQLPRQWSLEIAGDGPLAGSLRDLAHDLGIADRIEWRGFIGPEMLAQSLSRADILLQPSRTADDGDTEGGAPVVLLDAGAAALPVVSTRHADIPFLIEDEATGLLADERDVEGLAERLVRLGNPALRARMGAQARERVEASFTAQRTRALLASHYVRIARGQPVP